MGRTTLQRVLGALVIMAGGSATVFGLMLVMNHFNKPPKRHTVERTEKFTVAPKPKPPKNKPQRKRRARKARPMKSHAAPPPSLNSAIGTVSLNLPGFAPTADLKDASRELLGNVQASVMTADSVDQKPRPIRQVQPELPRRLVAKQIEGKVIAQALIDENGRVEKVRIKRATPPGVFDQLVEQALRQWQFQPATYKGKPVKMWATVPFHFKLG